MMRQVPQTPEELERLRQFQSVGADFSSALGWAVLRAEGAFVPDKVFETTAEVFAASGVDSVEAPLFSYVAGIDLNLPWSSFASFQVIQELVGTRDERLARDPVQTAVTALLRRSFQQDRMVVELAGVYNVRAEDLVDGDFLVRPQVTYDVAPGASATLTGYIFRGDPGTLFGDHQIHSLVRGSLAFQF